MSLKDWYRGLGPKSKFAIKAIVKVAAVSAPVVGDQLHTLFDCAFEELQEHEEGRELMELTQLVNQRFEQLIAVELKSPK